MRGWSAVALGYLAMAQAAVLRQQGVQATDQSMKNNFLLKVGSSSLKWEPPWENTSHHASSRLTCGVTEQVGAHTDKYEDCPAGCPYFAQNRKDTEHCTFLCVPGDQCGQWNPLKPIPDSIKNTKTCRGPMVAFCTTPKLDGTDTCDVCMSGYALHHDDGQCYFSHWTAIIIGTVIFVALFTVVIAWFTDMCIREPVNADQVERAEAWRSRSKIMQQDADGTVHTYPTFSTNLCTTDVAGPGMMLHFRFQRFFIIWPLLVAMVWTALAIYEPDLFILGTRKFGTPRHNCILVAWGYETQQRLMWTKVLFLAIVYVGSFIGFLWFSVDQDRQYKKLDVCEQTMKDFALELTGLPPLPGTDKNVEEDLKAAVEDALKENGIEKGTVVGVSIAWNYQSSDGNLQENVDNACNADLFERQIEWELEEKGQIKKFEERSKLPKKTQEAERKLVEDALAAEKEKGMEDATEDYGALRKWLYAKEKGVLGPDDAEDDDERIVQMLQDLKTSDTAFVVFTTEKNKESALDSLQEKGIKFKSKHADEVTLSVTAVCNEPANLNWHNFGDPSPNAMMMRFWYGFFTVYVPALLIWFFCFYVPYAWSLYNFNYDNGAELPGYYSIIFTIVVCGGNATMYVVCDLCCDIIGFRYKDTKQVTYMLMYLVACMINVFLDMVVTYYTALKVMVGLDFRTYHGVRLADIDVFTEQFETYAMQRSLGANTYSYAWPSTFFLCFVLEPFVTILVPYQLGKIIIRTHTEIRGTCAEAYLMAFEFDLGRYADILLNVFLGILIFYFPGGYIWSLFYAMCFSHCFIYCFDHWRVLNVIPTVKIVSDAVDWWAQVMMCFCCAIILSCLVFKMNCETYAGYCIQEFELLGACTVAGTAHFIVHFLLLYFLVPKLGERHDPVDNTEADMEFKAVAAYEPRTWFSANPVHCLRSKYIQLNATERKEKIYCRVAAWGKEHLLQKNDAINCHFFRSAAEIETYDFRKSIKRALTKQAELEKGV